MQGDEIWIPGYVYKKNNLVFKKYFSKKNISLYFYLRNSTIENCRDALTTSTNRGNYTRLSEQTSLIFMTTGQTFMEELEDLKRKGYTSKFIKKNDFLYCSEKDMNFRSYELTITEQFRYEDKNEPSKNTVIYTIESEEYGLKGFLVN